jgi:hypothetical protein
MIGIHHWKSSPKSVKCSVRKSMAFPSHDQGTPDAGHVNAAAVLLVVGLAQEKSPVQAKSSPC